MARPKRTTELGLLLLAAVVTAATYILVSLGRHDALPANIAPLVAVLLGLFVAAHVATRVLAPGSDQTLLPIAILLNGIGYVFIARLDEDLAGLQATWTLIGIGAYILTLAVVRRASDLAAYRWTLALVGLVLLLLPMLPVIGRSINGARLWIRVAGVSIQPGEFAKLALAVFFAAYLVERREVLALGRRRVGPISTPELRHLGPLAAAWAASLVVMVFERDLGSSLLFFALFVVMLWVATGRLGYVVVASGLFAAGSVAAWFRFDHVQERIDVWLDPWADPSGDGFQLIQSLFALAAGGLTGTGPGLGDPGRIPAAETDFIFAVIAEELGFLGATTVLAGFVLLVATGLRIAVRATDPFEKLLAVGFTTVIGVQSFIIIGGVIRLVPLTGVTLPFVSYGGSSLLSNYILLALLVRLSQPRGSPPVGASPGRRSSPVTA